MRFLILGSGSFAGQALFSYYLSRNIEVYGINRSEPKDKYQWPWIDKYNSYYFQSMGGGGLNTIPLISNS